MKKFKRVLIGILVCIFLTSALWIGGSLNIGNTTKVSADLIETRLEEISELSTLNYHYKNMALYENNENFYGVTIPFTTKKFIVSYNGEIKSGVDLSDLKVKVSGKKITITLPKAKIFSHAIDEKSIVIFDEQSSLFNPLKISDMATFTADQKAKIEKEAIDKGLLTEASEKSKKIIKSTLMLDKKLFEEYEIVFNNSLQ